jgi:nucleotide-binding universal stress UspA family protein
VKILLAIDGSTHSAAALEDVAPRQSPPGSEVEVLTIVRSATPLLPDPAFVIAAAYVETTQESWRLAPDLLATAAGRLRRGDPARTITTKPGEGTPRELIVRTATDRGADRIVIGRRRRRTLSGSCGLGDYNAITP